MLQTLFKKRSVVLFVLSQKSNVNNLKKAFTSEVIYKLKVFINHIFNKVNRLPLLSRKNNIYKDFIEQSTYQTQLFTI